MPTGFYIMSEYDEVRKDISRLEIKIEQVLTEIKPLTHLYRGNGKPSLEARVLLNETDLKELKGSTRWATRTAVTAIASAAGTALWYILTK